MKDIYSVTIVLDADKFKSLVADNYKLEHRTEYYAERLFITPNYRKRYGVTPLQYRKSNKE